MLPIRLYSNILLTTCLAISIISCSLVPQTNTPKLNSSTAASLAPIATIDMTPLYNKISTNGGQYFAEIYDKSIIVTDLLSQTNITLQASDTQSAVLSKSGTLLASSSGTEPIALWTLPNTTPTQLSGSYGPITNMLFSDDENIFLAIDLSKKIYIWDLTNYELVSLYDFSLWPSQNRRISSIVLSPDNSTLGVMSTDDIPVIKLCSLADPSDCRTVDWPESTRPFYTVEFSPNWSHLVFISGASAQVFDLTTNSTGPLLTHEDSISNWKFLQDGDILAIYTAGTINQHYTAILKLWDTSTGENTQTFMRSTYTSATTINPIGSHIATSSDTGYIHIWDITTGAQKAVYSNPNNAIYYSLQYSPDGKLLASVDAEGSITLWDTTTHQALFTNSLTNSIPTSIDFSLDGAWLTTLTDRDQLTLWKPSDTLE